MIPAPNWLDNELARRLIDKNSIQTQGDLEQDENGYFVYHLDRLKQHLAELQKQQVVKLWYAVKANSLSHILKVLDQQGFNFDVASSGELQQVLKQGVNAERVLNTGPAKSKKQLAHFLKQGVNTFVVESLNQLKWLNEAALNAKVGAKVSARGKPPTVLLRVQLQWSEGEKNSLGGNSLTPFGLAIAEWKNIKLNDYPALDICGLHIFQWGNMLSNEKMYSLWSQMVTPLKQLAQQLKMEFKILDLGGGLGLDYLTQTQELSWSQIIADLASIKAQAGVDELWLELGRYAVGQCGYYVTEVVDKKVNYGEQQLVLAAGINHIIRPAITEQPFPVSMLRDFSLLTEPALDINYHLHGPLCTSLDKLGVMALPADVCIGEQLIFGYCGAYGFSESMPFFLCHNVAAEYVYANNQLTQVRAGQSASVYLR